MRGILFKEDLFAKVVLNSKTKTRRVIRSIPADFILQGQLGRAAKFYRGDDIRQVKSLYKVGDRLYLKEPYCAFDAEYKKPVLIILGEEKIIYKYDTGPHPEGVVWKPKLFMPEKYARYFIEITDLKVEHIQDISMADIIAEGFELSMKDMYLDAMNQKIKSKLQFIKKWNEINPEYSWDNNPWVWIYTFKLIDGP